MKKIIVSFLLLSAMIVCAQKDTSQLQSLEPSDSTGFGTPGGKSVSKEIGGAGGTIISEDGRVELVFPLGALTANRTISIQPTTNLAPNGTGKAYQFEPSGIQFKKPVQIIFRYTDEEAEECPPDLMGLAMQDHTGKWSFFDYEEWDSIGKILKGFIQHFSGLSNIKNLCLQMKENTILAEGRTGIEIIDITKIFGREMEGTSLVGQYRYGRIDMNAPILWYVNGKQNGNSLVGSVEPYENPTSLGNAKLITAEYKAPKFLPRKNPVIVSVDVYVYLKKTRAFKYKRTLKAKVYLYDLYKVKISSEAEFRAAMNTTMVDSAVAKIRITWENTLLDAIRNYQPVLVRSGTRLGCRLQVQTGPPAVGFIHLTPDWIKGYKLTQNENSPPEVTVAMHIRQLLLFRFRWDCRRIPTPPEFENLAEDSHLEFIQFLADGNAHVSGDGINYKYKIEITPIREEAR